MFLLEYRRARFISPLSLCVFALAIIVSHALDYADFISIDCGLTETSNYNDNITGIPYSTDANFTDSGENHNIARDYITDSLDHQLRTVRSFPQGSRNCYDLSAARGKGKTYLIRATFMYGNYDSENETPKFDLHLGVELWDTVEIKNSNLSVTKEIIHVPSSNYVYVCLINTGNGTPFISALELRPMDTGGAYAVTISKSLASSVRWNFAPADINKVIRYPNDTFDRLWQPYPTATDLAELRTQLPIAEDNDTFEPPNVVMQTAITPRSENVALDLTSVLRDVNKEFNKEFCFFFHFAELVKLQRNETRAFNINLNNQQWYEDPIVPDYLGMFSIYSTPKWADTGPTFDVSLVRTKNSTLPPLINALEAYWVKRFFQSQTDENDVWFILNIKSTYGVNNRNWQGDPCLPPEFVWQGLECMVDSKNKRTPPRIKSLNLSSSGLSGYASYLSNLSFLEKLDLSHNNLNGLVPDFLADLPRLKVLDLSNNSLNGPVPDFLANLSRLEVLDLSNNSLNGHVPVFLANLPHLEVLNLRGNQFSGSIPQELLDKANNGLELRADGYTVGPPNPCQSGQCNRKKSKKFVVPLVVSLLVSLTILGALIVIWVLKTGKRQGRKLDRISNKKNGFLETTNIQFSCSDLLTITNNFQRVLGKGGFGTVYYGVVNGIQVAVKLLSQSSAQGYNEFQTEAELLTRVHHRNLTSLVGYCYEDTNVALVYEYMVNGNLKELLSVTNGNVLSWLERLQIALDAAQGLDYLHNGCKPPIIHRDIKSTNILLNEKFEAKLGDFGLSRVFTTYDNSSVSTRVLGTPGYVDPEYYETQRLHEKSDIYSLGIVFLELITGKPVFMGTVDKHHILQWTNFYLATGDIGSIVDSRLNGMYDTNSIWKALEVAMACASPTSNKRPNMIQVVTELTECLVAEKARIEGRDTKTNDLLRVNRGVLSFEVGPR